MIISGRNLEDIDHISEFSPSIEQILFSRANAHEVKKPIKNHLPYKDIPKGQGRYIYIVRDGRDVAISYYHHYRRYYNYGQGIDSFIGKFLNGDVGYGDWFTHVSDWTANKKKLDLLLIRYEELKDNPRKQITDIAKFLGVDVSNSRIDKIIDSTSIVVMRQNAHLFGPEGEKLFSMTAEGSEFIRTGQTGEGKIHFSKEMEVRYLKRLKTKFNSTFLNVYRSDKTPAARYGGSPDQASSQ